MRNAVSWDWESGGLSSLDLWSLWNALHVLCCVSDIAFVYGKCTSQFSYPSKLSAFRYWVDSCLHLLQETAKKCFIEWSEHWHISTLDISNSWKRDIFNFTYRIILNCSTGDRACQLVFSYNVTDGCDTLLLYSYFLVQHTSQYLRLVPLIVSQEVYYTKLISSSLLLFPRLQNGQRKLPRPSYKWKAHNVLVMEDGNRKTRLQWKFETE